MIASSEPAREPSGPKGNRRMRRKVAHKSLVDGVTRELLGSMMDGTLRPGEQFSVAQISLDLGVSHIPVREALRRLEGQGFVELRPGRSAIVTPIDIGDVREIYDLRRLIEVDAIGRAAERYTDEDIEEIEALVEQMVDSGQTGDDRYWEAHNDFQAALVRPGIGAWTERLLRLLWRASERYYRLLELQPTRLAQPMEEHKEVLELVRRRAARQLQQLVIQHIATNLREIETTIGDLQSHQHRSVVRDGDHRHHPGGYLSQLRDAAGHGVSSGPALDGEGPDMAGKPLPILGEDTTEPPGGPIPAPTRNS